MCRQFQGTGRAEWGMHRGRGAKKGQMHTEERCSMRDGERSPVPERGLAGPGSQAWTSARWPTVSIQPLPPCLSG